VPVILLIIGLATSLGFLILLVVALRNAVRLRGAYIWLAPVALLQLLASLLYLLPDVALSLPVSLYIYSGSLVMFGALTHIYLKRDGLRGWLALSGVWWLLIVGLDVVEGAPLIGQDDWMNRLLTALATDIAGILTLAGWIAIGLTLSGMAFYTFYRAHLPEIANRALFWTTIVPVMILGLLLIASGSILLTEAGTLAVLAALGGATYGVVTHRIFDVRRALFRAVGMLVATTATGLVILIALILARSLTMGTPSDALVLGALALVVAAVYVPLRDLAAYLIRQLFASRADSALILRHYSQQIAAVIEIEEVIQLAMQTLSVVLGVRSGGLILTTETSEGSVVFEPMPTNQYNHLPPDQGEIAQQGPIYQRLFKEQALLLQFDLEYSPEYTEISEAARVYFARLRMSAYAPIIVDGRTIGLLVSGAKVNDQPFSAADLEIMATIANQTGVALRNARLVTDLRRLNQDLETANVDYVRLDQVKTDFITIASHELRTPLAQIRGYTDIIEALNDQGMLDPGQMGGMTKNLRKAAERMEELISDMLDVSKLDVDAMDLHFSQTTMEAVIRMAIEPLTEAIRSRKLSFSARGLRGLPPMEADMQRLVQAFRNVIVNAVKFTPDGGMIEVRTYEEKPDLGVSKIHVEIADTGIGIDPAHHELVFEKFFRAADPSLHSTGATKFMGAGPGLGLTIARGMIEGHGGEIWVESPGYDMNNHPGSVFHVVLPVEPPAHARQVLPFEETKLSVSTEERKDLMQQVLLSRASQTTEVAGQDGA
jgi:signal transduction histidine kinase